MQTPQKIAIIGSGLVGTLLAIYLKKQGHTVHVYDRSSDIRTVAFSGRSINLVMSNRLESYARYWPRRRNSKNWNPSR